MSNSSAGVKVAIRVRPFSAAEKKLGEQSIVSMDGKTTTIIDPQYADAPERKAWEREFVFDYSFWSHVASDAHFCVAVARGPVVNCESSF